MELAMAMFSLWLTAIAALTGGGGNDSSRRKTQQNSTSGESCSVRHALPWRSGRNDRTCWPSTEELLVKVGRPD